MRDFLPVHLMQNSQTNRPNGRRNRTFETANRNPRKSGRQPDRRCIPYKPGFPDGAEH
jgi:hypothetical protein